MTREEIKKRLREAQRLLTYQTRRHFGKMTYNQDENSLISEKGDFRLKYYHQGETDSYGELVYCTNGTVIIEKINDIIRRRKEED